MFFHSILILPTISQVPQPDLLAYTINEASARVTVGRNRLGDEVGDSDSREGRGSENEEGRELHSGWCERKVD